MSLPRPLWSGVTRLVTSFAALHAFNAAISSGFNVAQLFVFARVLDPQRYSEIVLLTALSFYALPISQAVGRANFVALRGESAEAAPAANEASAVLYVQAVLLTLVACLAPLAINGHASLRETLESVLYVAVCLANNLWYYDIQPTIWALDRGKAFEHASVKRRLLTYMALPVLWFTGDFLLFLAIMIAVTIGFGATLPRMLAPTETRFRFRPDVRALNRRVLVTYLGLFWPALLSSLTELVVLNSPYALLAAAFGTGPALVAFDTVMKLARLAMTVARNLSESALPRLNRLFVSGDGAALWRLLGLLFGICALEGLVGALVMSVAGTSIFRLLLGPNDVLPPGTQYVAACIVLVGCIFQPATYVLAFNGARRSIQQLTLAAALGIAVFAGLVLSGSVGLMGALWLYAGFFAVVAILATVLAVVVSRRVGRAAPPPSAA